MSHLVNILSLPSPTLMVVCENKQKEKKGFQNKISYIPLELFLSFHNLKKPIKRFKIKYERFS